MSREIARRPLTRFFREHFLDLLPEWLTAGEGYLTWWVLGLLIDSWLDNKGYQATYARFPSYAPDDALPFIARDRKLVRGPNEPAEVFAERALRWRVDHRRRGGPWALLEQLRAYCYPAQVRVRTVDDRGNWFSIDRDGTWSYKLNSGTWDWDSTTGRTTRFWVIVYPETLPNGRVIPWAKTPKWGEAGRKWGTRGLTWGTTATSAEVAAVRQICRTWKPSGTRCERIIIAYDDSSFDPDAPEPDGTWQNYGTGNDPRVPNRLSSARYWKGTGPA